MGGDTGRWGMRGGFACERGGMYSSERVFGGGGGDKGKGLDDGIELYQRASCRSLDVSQMKNVDALML